MTARGMFVTLISFLSSAQTPEASVQGSQRSGKAVPPPHALALYQQQITMAHGESSQEVKQQQPSGQPGKQQPYIPQADRDREALHSSSPRIRPRTPTTSEKDGTHLPHGTEMAVHASLTHFKVSNIGYKCSDAVLHNVLDVCIN